MSSPPPPVSSLRSKFEQLAASSANSQPQDPSRRHSYRPRTLSNEEKRGDACSEAGRGASDSLGVPVIRTSSSIPDLKAPAKTKPAPPPPRGSRTPSPQPPQLRSSPSPPPVTQVAGPSTLRKAAPPPIPAKSRPVKVENDVDQSSAGGVAVLKSRFNENARSASPLGNGRPTVVQGKVPVVRSASTSTSPPPALPARPSASGGSSPTKGPRSSLPALSNLQFESLSPTILNQHSPKLSTSPAGSEDTHNPLLRIPPPIPSRTSDIQPKAPSNVLRPDHYRSSSESGSSSSGERNSPPPMPPRRVPPPPLPPRRSGSEENLDTKPALPRRPSWDDRTSSPSVPITTKPIRATPPLPPPSRVEPPSTRITTNLDPSSSRLRNSSASPSPATRILNGIEPPPVRTLNGIPPPPVRTLGPRDKLPAARRRKTSDDDSDVSSDENDPSITLKTADASRAPIDELPDATHCSRRPPISQSPFFRASVPALSGSTIAVAGTTAVVAYHHHLRIYDLSKGVHSGLTTVDIKDLGLDFKKEARVTAMEFRTGDEAADEAARYVWCGTKEGHLFEFDTARIAVVRLRPVAHLHAVTKIMRYGRSMVTLDENGKALVWKDYEDLAPGGQQPRVARTMEKQGFIRIFDGMLWLSNGSGSGSGISSSNGSSRGPTIRVYDITASNTSAKIVTPSEPLGAVTSGAVLPAHPGKVYLGHEGGYVSIWSEGTDTFDSGRKVPVCIHTLKVASTDILALEGVMDRLWAGSRGGFIAAYDVGAGASKEVNEGEAEEDMAKRPWRLTNAWRAHGELPVSRIFVDPYSVAKAQTLNVISIGRDEQLRFWDGLLGVDWIESELLKREAEFSTFRPLNVLICSWNTDAQKPDSLISGKTANITFLKDVLTSVDRPDVIVFGFQELIDLENKSLTAKTVLLGSQKKNADGTLSEKVSRSYRMWYEALVHAVRLAMPVDDPYVVAHSDHLVGLFSCIFVRQRQKALLRDSAMKIVKRGMGGRYGNKGAIVARFVFDDTSLCFINCHLAAGQSHTRQRNQDIAAIMEDGAAFPRSEVPDALAYAGGGDGTMIMDHEICFLNGDLNYRIDLRRDAIVKAVQEGDYAYLMNHDQLHKQLKSHPGFRLRTWVEPPINFAPTYKYDRRSEEYDTSEKRRAPAWCDRILWHCRHQDRVRALHYTRYEVDVSDHRPISGAFAVTVKKVDQEARAAVKSQVHSWWKEREAGLLFEVREFYESRYIL